MRKKVGKQRQRTLREVSKGQRMSGTQLKFKRKLSCSLVLVAAFGLAACNGEEGAGGLLNAADSAAPGADMVERDVEAPEVFSVNEQGLWDGRPSLGGVWVAHPDVNDPERVIIRNENNGQFVIGALFRRERENPGPALQVSSDAAEELGLLAGAPTTLNVVALRRQDTPASAGVPTTSFDETEEVETASLSPVDEIGTTSLTAPDAEEAPTPAPQTAAAPNATSSLDKPFIQIGIFSVEDNADRNADRLRAAGLSARVLSQESNGRPFWRVVVGPAPTADDRETVLSQVKDLGFADSYAVSN